MTPLDNKIFYLWIYLIVLLVLIYVDYVVPNYLSIQKEFHFYGKQLRKILSYTSSVNLSQLYKLLSYEKHSTTIFCMFTMTNITKAKIKSSY